MAKQKRAKSISLVLVLFFSLFYPSFVSKAEAATIRPMIFPVIGKSSFVNDFNEPRYRNGEFHHVHKATDIIAKKGQKLVAAVNGTVIDVQYPKPSWGYSVTIRDNWGYEYTYIHINDDNPGTNDGSGGGMNAYAADIEEGKRVVRGQLIGWVGDSGYSNGIPHLHFEMVGPHGTKINPYYSLKKATKIKKPTVDYPKHSSEILPHGNVFRGGASISVGNLDGDPESEIVIGAGKGGRYVKKHEKTGHSIGRFAPNGKEFLGGVDVATGDVDNDGVDEIITGAGKGGRFVKVFEPEGVLKSRFAPYGNFKGGINVSTGDVDNDGVDEIITGAGKGGGPRVSIFELNGTRTDTFYAYSQTFKGGISVASGDLEGNNADEIITGAGKGGGPRVSIFTPSGTQLNTYYAYSSSFKGGIKVESGEINADTTKEEVVTVPANKGSSKVKLITSSGYHIDFSEYFAEEWWKGPYDIGMDDETLYSSIGENRRTSIRQVTGL